jgi:hypothetical protein
MKTRCRRKKHHHKRATNVVTVCPLCGSQDRHVRLVIMHNPGPVLCVDSWHKAK